jgi:hypothetical protein
MGMEVEQYRMEPDLIGEMQIPADALNGIHTVRSFPLALPPVRNLLDIFEKNKNSQLGDSKMMR